ncbi:Plasmodium vivax Vir protein, putative [Plasmodium vivax]|uniref:Vir protein, putative n=1 Tax=Plasmodium vivax TaxID=5855 RepID=A0A1G4E617_PLAVI|nr:Plasmodium vivax Vir protein, putative [Plasmodium vivax]
MDMLFSEFNITDNGMICQSLNTSIDKDTFKKNKMLYEYSQNHESIRLHTLPINTTCDSEYNETMQKYMNIYKNAHFDCTQGDQTNYDCSYFHKLFKSDEHMKLTSFYCRQQNEPVVSTETHEGFEAKKYIISASHTTEGNPEEAGHQDTRKHSPRFYHDTQVNTVSQAKSVLGDDILTLTDHTAEGGPTKTIMGSVVPVLGVSSISLLLYKVTPVGGFINKLLGRNMNMHNNIENMDMFNPYSDEMDPGGRRMNISYHRF